MDLMKAAFMEYDYNGSHHKSFFHCLHAVSNVKCVCVVGSVEQNALVHSICPFDVDCGNLCSLIDEIINELIGSLSVNLKLDCELSSIRSIFVLSNISGYRLHSSLLQCVHTEYVPANASHFQFLFFDPDEVRGSYASTLTLVTRRVLILSCKRANLLW